MTRYLIHSMQRISNLQSDIASTPTSLGELDHDFRFAERSLPRSMYLTDSPFRSQDSYR